MSGGHYTCYVRRLDLNAMLARAAPPTANGDAAVATAATDAANGHVDDSDSDVSVHDDEPSGSADPPRPAGRLHQVPLICSMHATRVCTRTDPRVNRLQHLPSSHIVGDAASVFEWTYPPPRAGWYYCSDLTVREVTLDEVLKAQAYILFYERFR